MSAKDKGRFWLGLSACFVVLGASAYVSPSLSSQSGRWGWIHQAFFNEFGAAGDVILYSLLAVVALVAGLKNLSAKEQ